MQISKKMTFRESLHLKRYDYKQPGYYYLTLCTRNRACLFGEIRHERMVLSEAGRMVLDLWSKIPERYLGFAIDSFVVMPNHVHGILIKHAQMEMSTASTLSVPEVIRNYKSCTMNNYIRGVKEGNLEPFDKKLWQRNYYEHIIRSEASLTKIRQYIEDNPRKWHEDRENPLLLPARGPAP